MASDNSFDVVSKVDMQEVKNAVDQAVREVDTRFDFKGSDSSIDLDDKAGTIKLASDNDLKFWIGVALDYNAKVAGKTGRGR